MTDPEQDEAFATYLKRRSVLPSGLPSDDRLEPPAALDAIVLKKAREAIKAPAVPARGRQQMYRAPRWAVPVALAATIMLCLSVVMNISLNTNRPTPAANLQRMAAARADVNARTEGNISGDRRESVPGDIPSHEIILPEARVASSAAPHHPPVVAEAAPGAPPASAPMAPAPSAAPAPAPPTDEPRLAARSATDKAAMFAKRADASVPGAAPSAAGAASDSSTGTNGYRAAAPAEPPAAAAPAPDTAATATMQAATAGGSQAAAAAGPHPADPKAWLQQIDALRAAGKIERADAEMRRFRAAFPGYAAKPAPPASSESPK